jgi:hypothetical protein
LSATHAVGASPALSDCLRRWRCVTWPVKHSSHPPVLGRALGADDHFLDNLLTFPAPIIGMELFAFARLIGAKERVGSRTIGVLLGAPLKDNALASSPGRYDTSTQLTAKHGNEPINDLRGGSCLERVARPVGAQERRSRSNGSGRQETQALPKQVSLPANRERTGGREITKGVTVGTSRVACDEAIRGEQSLSRAAVAAFGWLRPKG